MLDGKGERFAELFEQDQRRVWVPLAEIPEHVQKAFIAAEDKRFYQHKGIDERALIRAFIGNLAQSGRPQGGSTITQQVVKNLLVGEDVTYERKMREMIVASRIERTLSKAEILELYLNSTYLGRGSWGVEMAARSYFGKSAKALTLGEGALLAGADQGAELLQPRPASRRARRSASPMCSAACRRTARSPPTRPSARKIRRRAWSPTSGRGATSASISSTSSRARPRRSPGSTRSPPIPTRCARPSIRNCSGRPKRRCRTGSRASRWTMAGSSSRRRGQSGRRRAPHQTVDRRRTQGQESPKAARQAGLAAGARSARLPLYDVHWPAAVVLEKSPARGGGETIRVGLADGRVVPLSVGKGATQRMLKLNDVVFVRVIDAKGKNAARGAARAARWCRARRWCSRTRPAASSPWRAAFPIR